MQDTHKRGLQAVGIVLAVALAGGVAVTSATCHRRPDPSGYVRPSWENDGDPLHRILWEAEQDRQQRKRPR
jgi:hypothetical protein